MYLNKQQEAIDLFATNYIIPLCVTYVNKVCQWKEKNEESRASWTRVFVTAVKDYKISTVSYSPISRRTAWA